MGCKFGTCGPFFCSSFPCHFQLEPYRVPFDLLDMILNLTQKLTFDDSVKAIDGLSKTSRSVEFRAGSTFIFPDYDLPLSTVYVV